MIDTLSLPLEERAARRALRDFSADAGFDYYAYLHLRGPESFTVSNYPREWQDIYVRNNYLRVDPVVTNAKHGPSIFSWSAADAKRSGRRDVTQFYSDASRFGILSGLSVSVPVGFKDRMVFTLASDNPRVRIDSEPDPVTAAVAVAFVHSRLGAASHDATMAADIHLSPREAECLRWFADGMSMPDIAETIGIGYRSVRSYLDAATRKLGASNSRQATSIAIRLGMI
ncbi:autoinducer binding domain-containing protein [Jiella pelagia]|uniref:Autoinducer binding domain-containing protein n=1 Tax=Jiella pelagia TaxID=2986949 RepID=A0ABY7BTC0_9HYPH|nr:autoinducer binding domain-containing protein [Jiella pelagia]WAP66708.1 autoinducer binding domain-containing protein [Jiella pelagia]